MIDYPFTPCLHPKHIKTRTGEDMVVPCGHCKACALKKSNKAAFLCSIEEQDHRFAAFITLTYSNEYVPKCKPVLCKDKDGNPLGFLLKNNTDRLLKEGETLGFDRIERHKSGTKYMEHLLNKVRLFGYLPYLSQLDLQRFMKRFRKQLIKYTDEKVRYYAVGEYESATFRPHYHIILYFDEQKTLSVYTKVLRKAWKFGRVDASISRHGISSYVAGYVNSSCSLPATYNYSSLKPFSCHSVRFAQSLYQSKRKEIYENALDGFITQSREVCGSVVEYRPGGLLRLRSSQSVENILASLMRSYCGLIQYYDMQRKSTETIR